MVPPRPRGLVPIRGSRQMSGGLGLGGAAAAAAAAAAAGGGDASKRPKRRARKRRAYDDSFSSSGDDEEYGGYGLAQWEEEELAAEAEGEEELRLARRPRRARRSGFDSDRGETDGEGLSAGTTTASPGGGPGGGLEVEALPFAELSRMLTAEGVNVDPATLAGLTQRRATFVAAAAAAAGLPPPTSVPPPLLPMPAGPGMPLYQSSAEPASTHLPPFFPPNGGAGAGGSISVDGAVATLNRQVQLEHALLEQSMWVQKLAAEVQVRGAVRWRRAGGRGWGQVVGWGGRPAHPADQPKPWI